MKIKVLQPIFESHPRLIQFLGERPSTHYKVYKIPKRSVGFRTIAQPTSKLKIIQRDLVKTFEHHLDIHSSATAYVKGKSIKDNALVHVNSNYLLKIDINNFFNSLGPQDLFNALEYQKVSITEFEKSVLKELVFWNRSKKIGANLVLSVGAPSSPYFSNIIMYEFDILMSACCDEFNVNYSRYADDLTYSTKDKDVLPGFYKKVNKILLKVFGGRLRINESKTVFSSKANNRHVTGVTLTNNNKISIGRDRKRYVSALVHKFKFNLLEDPYEIEMLKGYLGFIKHLEPDAYKKIVNKYGLDVIKRLNNS